MPGKVLRANAPNGLSTAPGMPYPINGIFQFFPCGVVNGLLPHIGYDIPDFYQRWPTVPDKHLLCPGKKPQMKVCRAFFLNQGQMLDAGCLFNCGVRDSDEAGKFLVFGLLHVRDGPDVPQGGYHQAARQGDERVLMDAKMRRSLDEAARDRHRPAGDCAAHALDIPFAAKKVGCFHGCLSG